MSEAPRRLGLFPRWARDPARLAGVVAALLWLAFCVRWFDVAEPWRPPFLSGVSPFVLLGGAGLAAFAWMRGRWRVLAGPPLGANRTALMLILSLAFFFVLPVVIGGASTTVTADGALSGIVALHLADGGQHAVFVPHVPYSGSLKSHLTAPLTLVMDPARAFTLASVLFYLAHVAGLFRLALLVGGPGTALLAGLYAAFGPAFVTRYSLSNDGNYVEVLALGTWTLWLAARWLGEKAARSTLALAAGLLLGLGFWCHILAVIHLAAVAALFTLGGLVGEGRRGILRAPRSLIALALGWAIGDAPGLLWNLSNDWLSFDYLLPGTARGGEAQLAALGEGLAAKVRLMVTDHWPVLMGYDVGYGPALDRLLLLLSWLGVAAALFAAGRAARCAWRERSLPLAFLLFFGATNLAIALLALPHVPGNPRYILFLMSVIPVLLADAFGSGWRRIVLFVLVTTGALTSLAQVPPTLRQDVRWRAFVAGMEREGVRFCYTDFYLATRVNFLSRERIICSAKLGPTTTEYFFEYRERVEQASEAAFIAVNRTSADRLERRLQGLGVGYERIDLMKPVLLRLTRKVDPEELFPGREFPTR